MDSSKKKRDITELNEKELDEYISKKRVKISNAKKKRKEIIEQRVFSELKSKLEEDFESIRLKEWIKGWKGFRFIEKESDGYEKNRGSWIMKILDEKEYEIIYQHKWNDTFGEDCQETNLEIITSNGMKFPWELDDISRSGNTEIAIETKNALGLEDVKLSDFVELLTEMIDFVAEKYEVRSNSDLCVDY